MSQALAIPDPRKTPVPFGWCEATAEAVLEATDNWDALDEAEGALAAYVSWLESHGVDTTEFLKAMRLVEKRRADLLGPAEHGGDRRSTEFQVPRMEVEASPATISRWRRIQENWEWLRPIVMKATRPSQVSQARLLRLVEDRAELKPLPEGTYRTIVADPPWRYDNKATRGAAEDHYSTMGLEDICALEVPAAEDAHLYLWTTNAFLRPAFDVVEAWGFTYKTCLTWMKPQIGLGNYFRNATEHVLFGVKGTLGTQVKDVPTYFKDRRGKHSAKPDSFFDLVERCSPEPYLEMFARRRRMGWQTWGNEA